MDNREIIKNFLEKMAKQDNRCTASPYFYVIKTEVEDECIDTDYAEITRYYDPEDFEVSYDSKTDARNSLKQDGYTLFEIDEIVDRLEKRGIRKRFEKRGMFLTEEDAVNHLQRNKHHYSSNAYTYIDHAWRAPELKKFFEALFNEFNIEKGNWG